uniref:Dihydroorotate dehydrogenase catalytic domain-containing protein n=1 Tax=Amphora coffeiformis TaxID=265554 RepID=A0A7S3P8T8_9STRA|mmetsp:Transcript_9729/g.18620  ORF Transcript_9729/g.18620 Transcript_9729/m.18620 type:complete len:409 (-) Transcript_9729:101-1327(-)
MMPLSPDLSTTVAGLHLSTCLYNASGPRSGNSTVLHKVAASAGTGAVLSKSATLAAQAGNPQPRTHHAADATGGASFNSEGLPNNGIDYYIAPENINEILQGISNNNQDKDKPNKPYIVSLSGKTLDDNLEMLQRIAAAKNPKIAAIELNLACPNIIGKPIIAYDVAQMRDILQAVRNEIKKSNNKALQTTPLGIKLAPYLDMVLLGQVASLINDFKDTVKYIVTINTLGNALCIDTDAHQPFIASNNGFAGLSGTAVHYTALANVRALRNQLDTDIDIVGVGGVGTGEHAAAMLLAGAAAVQIGTTHWIEGPACFERIANELRAYMQEHGFANIAELQAAWHLWTKEGAELSRSKKKQKSTASTVATMKTATAAAASDNSCMMLSAVLAVVAAVLLADKLGVVNLPL